MYGSRSGFRSASAWTPPSFRRRSGWKAEVPRGGPRLEQGPRLALIALLFAGIAAGQGADNVLLQFERQGTEFGLDIYAVGICNTTAERITFSSIIVRNAARSRGLRPLTNAETLDLIEREKRLSLPRIFLSASEVSGYLIGMATTSGLILKDGSAAVKSLPLLSAGALRLADTIISRHSTPIELPADILPTWIELDAGRGSCVEYRFFSHPGGP